MILGSDEVESSWNVMAHGDAREGKWRGNWRMEWVTSTLFTLPRDMVYPALLPLMRTPRLPAVDWTDVPADLNGLVRFAERRNLVSACVPSRFKRSLPTGCYVILDVCFVWSRKFRKLTLLSEFLCGITPLELMSLSHHSQYTPTQIESVLIGTGRVKCYSSVLLCVVPEIASALVPDIKVTPPPYVRQTSRPFCCTQTHTHIHTHTQTHTHTHTQFSCNIWQFVGLNTCN